MANNRSNYLDIDIVWIFFHSLSTEYKSYNKNCNVNCVASNFMGVYRINNLNISFIKLNDKLGIFLIFITIYLFIS